MSHFDLSVLFFLQLAMILVACRLVGGLARRFGQPQVVGEMIAGVVLGPSLFGLLAPEWQAWLFPDESKSILFAVSQLGLTLYMFIVGLEFRTDIIKHKMRGAVLTSIAGIITPFALGCVLAIWLLDEGGYFSAGVTLAQAMQFMGAAMSITAFPMLARIIVERGLSGSTVGTLALAAGATDDAVAWVILAVVLASFGNDPQIAVMALGGGLLYVVCMFLLVRPALRPMVRRIDALGKLSADGFCIILVLLMLGAWFTDVIQLYAVFGAFILGVAIPRGRMTTELRRWLEPTTVNLLLPLFFIYSGLNTRLDLMDSFTVWGVALAVLGAAMLGKWGACACAARISGESWRDSMAIGSLMNARGLMELIILNIGLQRGLISPTLFSVMVLMAILTTLMATPLFERFIGKQKGAGLEREDSALE